MRLYSLLVLAFVVFSVVLVVQAEHQHNSIEEKTLESKSLESIENDLTPHRRSKRTIGHIFDMFKKMMDGLFGGGKGKGKGKGRGRGRRPNRPGAGYGAPPQQGPRPGYGAPAPRPPRPPPPPRNPGLSGGYAGGNAPPRRPPQQQAPNNYGGPVQQAPNNYGGPVQQAPNNYGGPQQDSLDSYGSPAADPIGNQDSYGSPAADPVGAQDSYGSPVAAPVGPAGGQRAPSSDFGPSSVFYEIPAPNLATEAPQGAPQRQNQDSYGSPQAAPIGGQRQNQDSYGSPQAAPIGGQRQNQDSYGSPQASPITPNSAPAANSYSAGNAATPQVNAAPVSNNYGAAAPAPSSNNPFLSTYGNSAAPLPVTNNDLSGQFVPNQNSYGSPQPAPNNYGAPAPAPVTDLNLPDQPEIVIQGRGNQNQDSYGSPGAGDAAPAPISSPENEVIVDIRDEDVEQVPEGEVTSTQLESEGEESPLFEDLRNVDFTTAGDSTEPIPVEGDPIEVDLSDGVVDLTNGLDAGPSGPVDLTTYNESPETTISPNYEYEYETEYDSEDYFGDPDVPPEIPDLSNNVEEEEELDIRTEGEALPDSQESYGDAQESVDYDAQESYGNNGDDEYYYDEESDYYYDDYEEDQSAEYDQEPEVTTYAPDENAEDGANFISVPLMIEEVTDTDAAPVILAGTSDTQATYGGGNTAVRSSRRAPYSFQSIFHNNQADNQAKRQISDWSQRLSNARRNRVVWRQFNLD